MLCLTTNPAIRILSDENAAFDGLLQESNDGFLESANFSVKRSEVVDKSERVLHGPNQTNYFRVSFEDTQDQLNTTESS